jgi:hypothetical protein
MNKKYSLNLKQHESSQEFIDKYIHIYECYCPFLSGIFNHVGHTHLSMNKESRVKKGHLLVVANNLESLL